MIKIGLFGKKEAFSAERNGLPASVCSSFTVFFGLFVFAAALFFVQLFYVIRPTIYISNLVLFILLLTALGVFLPDIVMQKVHRRLCQGPRPLPSWPRTLTKFAGLLGSLAFVAFFYWLFFDYRRSFFERYYFFLKIILPVWLLLALPYIRYVDSRMSDPEDGLWHMGRFVLLKGKGVDKARVRQHLMGWAVKGFFLPWMFSYMCLWLTAFLETDFFNLHGFKAYYTLSYNLLYILDVSFATAGYLFSLRLMDTHIRSTEPTFLGWFVALICYEPLWTYFGEHILNYGSASWDVWLQGRPVLFALWGSAILALVALYAFSTAAFGMRFSNLTHRGIITNGPYRWTKHPAYVSKNIVWWLISVPFVASGSLGDALRHCFLLLLLNGVYYLRAKTEERHLSFDPVYVQYAAWVDKHGLLAVLRRGLGRGARKIALLAEGAEKTNGV